MKIYYDFHVHSCLSPCADNDNTPNNIAGMASLCGLSAVALTDHNTVKNCPAFFKAAKRYGIVPIAGMELTTQEDIHVICLFETLDDALAFGDEIEKRRVHVKNRPDIFGDQLITDGDDNIIGTDENLLSNATLVSYDDVPKLAEKYRGVAYPAHIDRQSNGVIAVLGTLPETPFFKNVEFNRRENAAEYYNMYPLENKQMIVSSDAHCLTDFRDKENYFTIPDGINDPDDIRKAIFEILR